MAEAGVALPAVGVEDPQRRPPPRWTGAIARDDHLRSLADDIPPEPDPGAPVELEANAGRLADGALEAAGATAGRLQHHERDPGPARERRDAGESIAESRPRAAAGVGGAAGAGGARPPARQIDDEDVHGTAREQRAGDRQPLFRIVRSQDDEPLRLDAASHGLHGIERRREVQPGHDRARGLRLRDEPQRERRPPARDVAANGEPHATWHAAGPEDGVERREAGRMDAIRICRRLRPGLGPGLRHRPEVRALERNRRERADDLADELASRLALEPASKLAGEPGRRRAPSRSKGRQGRGEVGGGSGHGLSIEQMFE